MGEATGPGEGRDQTRRQALVLLGRQRTLSANARLPSGAAGPIRQSVDELVGVTLSAGTRVAGGRGTIAAVADQSERSPWTDGGCPDVTPLRGGR